MEDNKKKCMFCGKPLNDGTPFYTSVTTEVSVCDNCVKMCSRARVKKQKEKSLEEPMKMMSPKEMKARLDENIIGQEKAKKAISIAVYNHYKRLDIETSVKIAKSNVLLIGPTGSGKTLIAQTIAEMLNVPFAIADCTSLTEAGYVGDDVETVLLKLIQSADGDIKRAEKGIIFLDEIDKLASMNIGTSLTKDPSGEGVQQALLKLIEGTVANVPPTGGRKNPSEKCIPFNTENVLFICGGAFPGLKGIINNRCQKKESSSIGFGAVVEKEKEMSNDEALSHISTEDLVQFGLIPEFIGRIPVVVSLNELAEDTMVEILTKPKNSIVNQYKALFMYDGVELKFTKKALKEIAHETIKRNTGARGLRSIIEETLADVMFEIPSDPDIDKCIVKGLNEIKIIRIPQNDKLAI